MFFAISGILICTRILEEESLLGTLNIRGFYIRRFFRIQPASFVYLAVIAVLVFAGWIVQPWKFWFGALLMVRNYQLNVTFGFACLSFYLVEKPFMRRGHRLAPPATPGRKDLADDPSIERALEV